MKPSADRLPIAAKIAILVFLAGYGIVTIRSPDQFRLLDNVDLAIHEAGHLVFAPFGEFMGFAGGTLFQLMLPLAFLGYFLRQHDRFAAAVTLWWVAQNCWNIARYVKDARAQALPLVGGGEHDWTYLLWEMGVLHHDLAIGQAIYVTGVILFALSIFGGAMNASSAAGQKRPVYAPATNTQYDAPSREKKPDRRSAMRKPRGAKREARRAKTGGPL